ncbi:MAG: hypothetical protein ABSA40_10955 [Candidatus Dormibacteria bacterium]
MNVTLALRSVAALAVFPGAAYAGAVALLVLWIGRLPRGTSPLRLEEAVAAAGIAVACGLLALPDSPLSTVPFGVSLAGLLIAFAAAVAWGSPEGWPWHRVVAAVSAAVPLLGLGSAAMTLDLQTIAVLPGAAVGAARYCAVAAIVVALPAIVRPFDQRSSRPSRAALLAGGGLLAATLGTLAPSANLAPVLVDGGCAVLAVLFAGALALGRRLVPAADGRLGALAALPAAVSLFLALVH